MKMEQTECSETLVFKLQTPVNHPEESIRHSEHGESLKSRTLYFGCPAHSLVTVLTELTRFPNCIGQLACTGQDDTRTKGLKDLVRHSAWRSLVCWLSACLAFILLYDLQSITFKVLEFLEWLSDCTLQTKIAAAWNMSIYCFLNN
jgi:hypothetical protein